MVTITKNGNTYQLNDNGVITDLKVVQPKGWDPTLELPANSAGRKLMNIPKLEKALANNPVYELPVKAERKTSTPGAPRTVKGLDEYLDGEDKDKYLELVAKARAAREESRKKPPKTDLEKAIALRDKYLALVAELEAKENPFDELGELDGDDNDDDVFAE